MNIDRSSRPLCPKRYIDLRSPSSLPAARARRAGFAQGGRISCIAGAPALSQSRSPILHQPSRRIIVLERDTIIARTRHYIHIHITCSTRTPATATFPPRSSWSYYPGEGHHPSRPRAPECSQSAYIRTQAKRENVIAVLAGPAPSPIRAEKLWPAYDAVGSLLREQVQPRSPGRGGRRRCSPREAPSSTGC
jgi:hypothetical protein